MLDRLAGNTPELSDKEREILFNGLSADEQEQAADLMWLCDSPEQRNKVYTVLRQWYTDYKFGVN